MPHRRRFSTLAVGALALVVFSSACGLGDKQAAADRVVAARDATFESGGAIGTVTYEVVPQIDEDSPAAGAAAALGDGAAAGLSRSFSVESQVLFQFPTQSVQAIVVPPANPLAALAAAAGGGEEQPAPAEGEAPAAEAPAEGETPAEPAPAAAAPTEPTALFHRNTTYVKRTNVRPTEKRLWAKLDFGRLPDDENPPSVDETPGAAIAVAAANTMNPIYLLDIAEGVLAGSVTKGAVEDIDGVQTTRYEANISIDKALTDLDLSDDEFEIRALMFRLMRVRADVFPATFWVDPEGKLRKVQYEFEQSIDRRDSQRPHDHHRSPHGQPPGRGQDAASR